MEDSLAASRSAQVRVLAQTPAASTSASERAAGSSQVRPETPETAATSTPEVSPSTKSTSTKTAVTTESEGQSSGEESESSKTSAAGQPLTKLPPVKHVFILMLSNQPYASVFGPASTNPYLSSTLEKKGELLVDYDAIAHEELPNEVALISGQGPTVETAANCPSYTEITQTGTGEDEQVLGAGCVYPKSTATLPGTAHRQAPDLARLRAGHRRTGSIGGGLRPPRPRPARPHLRPEPGQRNLFHVPQPVRLLRLHHELAVLRDG